MRADIPDEVPPEPVLEVEVEVDGAWRPGLLREVRERRLGDVALDVEWLPADDGAPVSGIFPAGRVRVLDPDGA